MKPSSKKKSAYNNYCNSGGYRNMWRFAGSATARGFLPFAANFTAGDAENVLKLRARLVDRAVADAGRGLR